jgi:uncharacterized protein (DUF924 family)
MQRFEEILCFWFGGLEERDFAEPRKSWFAAEPEFDAEIRRLFLGDYERTARGEFDSWRDAGPSCLALTIVLDQFPRNMFRNDPRAYATDDKALASAEHAVRTGFDLQFLPVARTFFYLPFEHSENLEHQWRSVELTSALPYDSRTAAFMEHARGHKETIERFGRFPHRNAILGRESTPEELEFLRHTRQR